MNFSWTLYFFLLFLQSLLGEVVLNKSAAKSLLSRGESANVGTSTLYQAPEMVTMRFTYVDVTFFLLFFFFFFFHVRLFSFSKKKNKNLTTIVSLSFTLFHISLLDFRSSCLHLLSFTVPTVRRGTERHWQESQRFTRALLIFHHQINMTLINFCTLFTRWYPPPPRSPLLLATAGSVWPRQQNSRLVSARFGVRIQQQLRLLSPIAPSLRRFLRIQNVFLPSQLL
jgi:hypothetical protein